MLARSFKIVEPKRFDLYVEDIVCNEGEAILKVDYAAICKADIRYYLGSRKKKILGLKYPMNLIHEAVGTIVKDKSGDFSIGDIVVPVPNLEPKHCVIPCRYNVCETPCLGTNYCPYSKFASSNYNGFSREFLSYPAGNLIKVPQHIVPNIATFCELISVAVSALRRIDIKKNSTIAVWGDGILGFILCSVICCLKKESLKGINLYVIGKNMEKLKSFPSDNYFLAGSNRLSELHIDIGFECVGGKASGNAINEIIDNINPGGKIILTGVSEDLVEISTRKILEKGLSLYGVTRSNISDFKKAILLFNNNEFTENISKLILSIKSVTTINDYYSVFESEITNKKLGKTIMKFEL